MANTGTKFTAGPWKHVAVEGGWDGVKPESHDLLICKLVENNPANARLIAAAPDLLRALRNLTIWHDKEHPEHDAMIEAYAESFAANDENPSSAKVEAELLEQAHAALAQPTT